MAENWKTVTMAKVPADTKMRATILVRPTPGFKLRLAIAATLISMAGRIIGAKPEFTLGASK